MPSLGDVKYFTEIDNRHPRLPKPQYLCHLLAGWLALQQGNDRIGV
jgi:hypothetical protein